MLKIHISIGSSYNNEISTKLKKKKSLICNDRSVACPIPCQNDKSENPNIRPRLSPKVN